MLQEGEYLPLGSDKLYRSTTRIVAATHADLKERMEKGTFCPDLYYRLCSHRVQLPSLRDRPEDIGLFAKHFIEKAAEGLGKVPPTAPLELVRYLAAYLFPGNVREMEALLHQGEGIFRSDSTELNIFANPFMLYGFATAPAKPYEL